MSTTEQLQECDILGSFESEVLRYRPKDMADFSSEYFKSLQQSKPLIYKDLTGLEPFELKPTDEAIISRLQIPKEDLEKVQKRRVVLTKESQLFQLDLEIDAFMKEETESKLTARYAKYKIGVFKANEFLSFLAKLYKVSIENDQLRIYFTKLFHLSQEEKNLIFKFLEADYKIQGYSTSKDWKFTLEKIDKMQKHTYYFYDSINPKLRTMINNINEGTSVTMSQAEDVYKNYSSYITLINSMSEGLLYDFLLHKHQFEREIIFNMFQLRHLIEHKEEDTYDKIERIYMGHFSRLSNLDYFNFVLMGFIPMLKTSVQTSLEHKEMESFLNNFIMNFDKIITVNFPEEKETYYNLETVKYFLNKNNTISSSKYIMIEIIQLFIEKYTYLTKTLSVSQNNLLKQFEIIKLQLNEFYKDIMDYCIKVKEIGTKYDISSPEMKEALRLQFKSNAKCDQDLILASLRMMQLFEKNKVADMLGRIINDLSKSFSIQELTACLKTKVAQLNLLSRDYLKRIKTPKDFDELHYLDYSTQCQIIATIILLRPELKNSAMLFNETKLKPYEEYNRFTDEVLQFSPMYYSLKLHKDMEDQCNKDIEKIKSDFERLFPNESAFINNNANETYEQDFLQKGKYAQKLIIVMMMFFDNLNQLSLENKNILTHLAYIYLLPIASFTSKKIVSEANELHDEQAALENNKLFLQHLMDETKDILPDCYVYYSFDRSFDFYCALSLEQKEICIMLLKANKATEKFFIEYDTKCYSIEELAEAKTLSNEEIDKELKKNRRRIYNYIEGGYNRTFVEIEFFKQVEKLLIINRFKQKNVIPTLVIESYNISYTENVNELKRVILSMRNYSNGTYDKDVQLYFCKNFFKCEVFLQEKLPSVINMITSIIENPYDKNNKYLKEAFQQFSFIDQTIILQMVLIKTHMSKMTSQYYSDIICDYVSGQISKLMEVAEAYKDVDIADTKFIIKEAEYLMKFFPSPLEKFIKELMSVENFIIHQFTRDFSSNERTIILQFLELYCKVTKKDKYKEFKEELSQYKDDMNYYERIDEIISQLNKVISGEIPRYLFVGIADEIKETALEIDYFIESICHSKKIEEVYVNLFRKLSEKQRTIVLLTLQSLIEQQTDEDLVEWQEELESIKDEPIKESMFVHVAECFAKIKNQLLTITSDEKKQDAIKEYSRLKMMFGSICGDLIDFTDNCGKRVMNVRKIRAVEPIKHKVLVELLEIEYSFNKLEIFREAINYITKE